MYNKDIKRYYAIQNITTANLRNWSEQNMNLYIYVYSSSMSSSAVFKKAKKALIDPTNQDRSGAASNSSVQELARTLQEKHRMNFDGTHIAFLMWANEILSMEQHLHAAAIERPPPSSIIHLFTTARQHPDNILNRVRQNVSIARGITSLNSEQIQEVRVVFDEIVEAEGYLKLKITEMDTRLRSLELVHRTENLMLSTVEETVEESTNSQRLFLLRF